MCALPADSLIDCLDYFRKFSWVRGDSQKLGKSLLNGAPGSVVSRRPTYPLPGPTTYRLYVQYIGGLVR